MATVRTSAPAKSNKCFYEDNPFYKAGYGLPNCTCFAWGCFYEYSGKKPRLSTSNAENWWGHTSDGYERGQEPKVGAVACWSKGKVGVGSDGAGHVAFVTKVYDDGSIDVCESGWKASKICWTLHLKKGYARSGYKFQGFIYPANASSVVTKKKTSGDSFKEGKNYVITAASGLKVRKGPGTGYAQKKKSELTADGQKHAASSKKAVLKKGTVITAVDVKGSWIKTPSGWICGKEGSSLYVKLK